MLVFSRQDEYDAFAKKTKATKGVFMRRVFGAAKTAAVHTAAFPAFLFTSVPTWSAYVATAVQPSAVFRRSVAIGLSIIGLAAWMKRCADQCVDNGKIYKSWGYGMFLEETRKPFPQTENIAVSATTSTYDAR